MFIRAIRKTESVAVNVLSSIYPYTLPNILLTYNNRSELEIKAQFIESLNTKSCLKEFKVDKTYKDISLSNRAINNQQKTKIKKCFIELVKLLEEQDLIESKYKIYKIISNGSLHETQELTTRNIYEGFVIYEKLSV